MSSHLPTSPKWFPVRSPLHKVVTRHNGLLFHGIALASLIEWGAPLHVPALKAVFLGDAEVRRWLMQEWWPMKAEHGQRLRAYVESLWPEFDWESAYEGFDQAYRPRVTAAYAGRSPSEVALSLCATTAQAAAFYRSLASYADDPELRELLREMGADEGCCFDYFRTLCERCKRTHPLRVLQAYRTIVCGATRARDGAARLAFSQLAAQWYGNAPFPALEYRDFLRRMGELCYRMITLAPAARLVFRPWFKPPVRDGADAAQRESSGAAGSWRRSRLPAAA
jgi:hypothetical protein